MNSFDPTEPLVDLTVCDGKPVFRLEQPMLSCPCEIGWFGKEWLYQRPPECNCFAQTNDFMHVIHDVSCDSVPCPFCPLEESCTP